MADNEQSAAQPESTQRAGSFWAKIDRAVEAILDTVINPVHGTTLRAASQELAAAGLDHVKSRLARAGKQNRQIDSSTEVSLANAQKTHEEARRVRIEADAALFELNLRKLGFALVMEAARSADDPAGRERKQIAEVLELLDALWGQAKRLQCPDMDFRVDKKSSEFLTGL